MPDPLTICEQAARAGGDVLQQWVGRFTAREKGPSDLVTEADLASQEAIRDIVLGQFPEHGFVSEEGEEPLTDEYEYCWIVDPLDGTMNYVHQVPHYAVSIALRRYGRVIVGAIYDPVNEECFTAEKGKGAFLNGRRLHVSDVDTLDKALIAASFSARVSADSPEVAQFNRALLQCQGVRRTGSAALNLCYVACGRFDAFWALSTKSWDVAAGVLLVEEAGGVVTDIAGAPLDLARPHPVASASSALHEQFLTMLNLA